MKEMKKRCDLPGKVLVKGPNWLGDALLSFPAVSALKALFPDSRLEVLTRRPLDDLWGLHPAVDRVIGYQVPSGIRRVGMEFALGRDLRKQGFDIYLALPRSFSSALIGFWAGIPVRVGYSSEGRGWLLTERVPRDDGVLRLHRSDYYMQLIRRLGEVFRPPPVSLKVPEEERRWAERTIRSLGIEGDFVGFNPGATYGEAKCWFPERFAELGKRLVKEGIKVVIFGTLPEKELNERISQEIGEGCFDLTGRTTIRQLLALLERARLLVTNDTGTMHAAAAVGTRVVAIFGSTDPAVTSPLGEGHRVIYHRLPCSPCLKRTCPCGHNRCMDLVTVQQVYEAVQEGLGS